MVPLLVSSTGTLIVESRDLDTDERSVATFVVDVPADQGRQREQLADVVARIHPDARMRSFGEGAASFLSSQRLVVAHYDDVREQTTPPASPPSEPVEQQALFAA